jgi:serine/threonine protein kinase
MFVKLTANLKLDPVGGNSIDYRRALAFAKNWTQTSPKPRLGDLEDRCLVDSLVDLVMKGCNMDAHPVADAPPGKFTFVDGKLRRDDGACFVQGEKLGEGAFGSAYVYRSDTETIVVKQLKPANAKNIKAADEALKREARVHAQAKADDSDHIVGFLGTVDGPDGRPMLLLEHAPNGDAATIQKGVLRALDAQELNDQAASDVFLTVFADMVKGANQAHKNGVTHRDIKPANYFGGKTGKYMLGDFGVSGQTLAEFMEPQGDVPDYLPPELIDSKNGKRLVTHSADTWALAVFLYESVVPRKDNENELNLELRLRLRRPFPYADFMSEGSNLIAAFGNEVNPDLRYGQLDLDPTEQLHQLIIQMLDPDPVKRPSLEAVLAHPSIAPYANPSNQDEEDVLRRARQWIIRGQANQLIEG